LSLAKLRLSHCSQTSLFNFSGPASFDPLKQGSQTQINWGPLEIESGSGRAGQHQVFKKIKTMFLSIPKMEHN